MDSVLEIGFQQSSSLLKHDFSEKLDLVFNELLSGGKLSGAVVIAAIDGEIFYDRAFGFADIEQQRPMKRETLFRLASVTKQYVSAAALALVSKGILQLDERISKWLPFFTPRLASGERPEITIRHLLSHTSGLSYGFLEPNDGPYHTAGVSDGMDESEISLEENLKRLGSVPLIYAPGANWGYSLATDVLGAVLIKATGTSLAQAVSELVTSPLGIENSGFFISEPEKMARAYTIVNDAIVPISNEEIIPLWDGVEGLRMSPDRAFKPKAFQSGGSGMVGTAHDLLVLLETLRRGGAPIMTPPVFQEMIKDHAPGMDLLPWPGRGYGLGFSILRDKTIAATSEPVGIWRMGGAYGHSWFIDPANGISLVAFTNIGLSGQSPGGVIPQKIADAIYANGSAS